MNATNIADMVRGKLNSDKENKREWEEKAIDLDSYNKNKKKLDTTHKRNTTLRKAGATVAGGVAGGAIAKVATDAVMRKTRSKIKALKAKHNRTPSEEAELKKLLSKYTRYSRVAIVGGAIAGGTAGFHLGNKYSKSVKKQKPNAFLHTKSIND